MSSVGMPITFSLISTRSVDNYWISYQIFYMKEPSNNKNNHRNGFLGSKLVILQFVGFKSKGIRSKFCKKHKICLLKVHFIAVILMYESELYDFQFLRYQHSLCSRNFFDNNSHVNRFAKGIQTYLIPFSITIMMSYRLKHFK